VREAALILADGSVFEGEAFGAEPEGGVTTGEVVFNTVLSGYQEVVTDPSYAGQIVTFTYPHIGNYGVTEVDDEARRVHCQGVIVRDAARRASSWRAESELSTWMELNGIPGITGIDTRRLTRHIRDLGAMPGAFGTATESELAAAATRAAGTDGRDLTAEVTCEVPYTYGEGPANIVAVDFGIKRTILRNFDGRARLTVVPATYSAGEIAALRPDGVFLSNGPGDPAAVTQAPEMIRELLDAGHAMFGICMGHQLLATALGGTTYKLPFGHHGGNHPVRDQSTGKIEITAQNHNYCVDPDSLNEITVTHVNLNDGTLEGFSSNRYRAFGIQYHPEAGPGPHDSRYLFDRFVEMITPA
jgi:carbamoyl-phosphate synthase small subunit